MYVYIYIYIYICVYAYVCIYIYIYIHSGEIMVAIAWVACQETEKVFRRSSSHLESQWLIVDRLKIRRSSEHVSNHDSAWEFTVPAGLATPAPSGFATRATYKLCRGRREWFETKPFLSCLEATRPLKRRVRRAAAQAWHTSGWSIYIYIYRERER